MKKKRRKHSVWPAFKLRAQLFKIWFMKNLLVWAQILLIVCVVFMLTGNITAQTPVLGTIIYPIFQPLIDEITTVVANRDIDSLMDFFAVAISLLMSISVFTLKLRSLTQTDIKSEKLKIAMIKANLYFNSGGKLVKKTEKMVGQDLDGDGKIDDKVVTIWNNNLITKTIDAVKEFKMIAEADLTGTDEENEEKYEKIMDKANLRDSKEALEDIGEISRVGAQNLVLDTALNRVENKQREIGKNTKLSKKEKVEKTKEVSFIKRVLQSLKNKVKKREEEKEETEVVISNRVDADSEVVANAVDYFLKPKVTQERKVETPKKEEKQQTKKEMVQTKKAVQQQKQVNNDIADFLNSFYK